MARQIDYNSAEHIDRSTAADPYLRPAFSFGNRVKRLVWNVCWAVFYRTSPRPFHAWRALLLRLFGAKLGADCHFYPASKVWAPWNLVCGPSVALADGAEIYNPSLMTFADHVIVSQEAYICGATHDYNSAEFPMLSYRMTFGAYAWICARACVGPGVNVGEGAVLGLAAVATRDLDPWSVYGGSPAIKVRDRVRAALT